METILYSNYFKIESKTFSFRKSFLFDITSTPKYLELKDNNGSKGYWINRQWYSISKIKTLIIKDKIKVYVSDLQWYRQIQLDCCFNLSV